MSATDVRTGPFIEEWTTPQTGATAGELAHALARQGNEAVAQWHQELATAVNELHRDRICAGSAPTIDELHSSWGVGDPIVALVRAVASLARRRPSSRSQTAQLLVDLLG